MTAARIRDHVVGGSSTDVGLLADSCIASVVLAADGRVTWSNQAARDLFDLPGEPVVASTLGARSPNVVARRAPSAVEPHVTALFRDLDHDMVIAQLRYVLDPDFAGRTRFAATARPRDRGSSPVDVQVVAIPGGGALLHAVDPPPTLQRSQLEHQRAFCDAIVNLSALAQCERNGDEFYEILLREVIDVVPGAQAGSILIRDLETDEFEFIAAEGFPLDQLRANRLSPAEMHCELTTGAAVIVTELDSEVIAPHKREWIRRAGRTEEIRASVSAPVMANGEAIAFLNANSFDSDDAFTTTSLEMMTVFSRLMSDLITRRRLEHDLRQEGESYRHLANHDPLTGLPNRRNIEETMVQLAGSSFGSRRPMALLFADLDDFKSVNDHHGHDAGDTVLRHAGAVLQSAIRADDIVGRWGGDEFVVVLPDMVSSDAAGQLGERIIERCHDRIRLPDGATVALKMSIGIAWTDNASSGVWALLRRADDAVYKAKVAGKGTVHISEG